MMIIIVCRENADESPYKKIFNDKGTLALANPAAPKYAFPLKSGFLARVSATEEERRGAREPCSQVVYQCVDGGICASGLRGFSLAWNNWP